MGTRKYSGATYLRNIFLMSRLILSHIDADLDVVTPIDVSSMAEISTTEGERAEIVLGKRRREWYVICHIRSAGLMMTIAVAMNCPRRGQSRVQMGSWRRRGPRRGPDLRLPPRPNRKPVVNPRWWDAERRGSHPRQHGEFTTDLCWDLVSRRGQWEPLRRENHLGLRRESRR